MRQFAVFSFCGGDGRDHHLFIEFRKRFSQSIDIFKIPLQAIAIVTESLDLFNMNIRVLFVERHHFRSDQFSINLHATRYGDAYYKPTHLNYNRFFFFFFFAVFAES